MSHWAWDHFFTDGTLYRNNNSNKSAWCLRCLAYHRDLIRNADTVAVAMSDVVQGRTPEEVEAQCMAHNFSEVD